jgi:hypothetical protein
VSAGTPVVTGVLRRTSDPSAIYRHTLLRVWDIHATRC